MARQTAIYLTRVLGGFCMLQGWDLESTSPTVHQEIWSWNILGESSTEPERRRFWFLNSLQSLFTSAHIYSIVRLLCKTSPNVEKSMDGLLWKLIDVWWVAKSDTSQRHNSVVCFQQSGSSLIATNSALKHMGPQRSWNMQPERIPPYLSRTGFLGFWQPLRFWIQIQEIAKCNKALGTCISWCYLFQTLIPVDLNVSVLCSQDLSSILRSSS